VTPRDDPPAKRAPGKTKAAREKATPAPSDEEETEPAEEIEEEAPEEAGGEAEETPEEAVSAPAGTEAGGAGEEEPTEEEAPKPVQATPKRPPRRLARQAAGARAKPEPVPAGEKKKPAVRAPRRPKLSPEETRLLRVRDAQDERRPRFVRQQAHRYYRIGRDGSWRRPRGLQSKQRRHYGYRPTVVSIGFRSPRRIRGRTPTGFRPVLVRTATEVERLDPAREAALVARTVGTRRRLLLEEALRRRGVHILNPLAKETGEA
jgi:large subunit ribosomal protein L32e